MALQKLEKTFESIKQLTPLNIMLNTYKEKVAEGDLIVLYGSRDTVQQVKVERGKILNNRLGHFHHNDIIDAEYGGKVSSASVVEIRSDNHC